MSRQLPQRGTARFRRSALLALTLAAVVLVSGCSAQSRHEWGNLAMPDPATEQGEHIFLLWRYAWVAALITGAIVWGLIFYVMWRFRRRSDDEIPVQTRYNLPLEIFYTVAPIIMVIVFFAHTLNTVNAVRDDSLKADHVVYVVGQQWSWTFNYVDEPAGNGKNIYTTGQAGAPPLLVIPVGETTEFKLHSPDVIHDFGVPGFLEKMDIFPGPVSEDNSFKVTPTRTGDFRGKCYELCGAYHSRMLFNVKIVSPEEYQTYLQGLAANGDVSDQPLLGGAGAGTQAGLESGTTQGGAQ